MKNYKIVFMTAPTFTIARHIAQIIVSEKLAACSTVLPNAVSIFTWKNAVEERSESQTIFKTNSEKYPALESRIKELHPDQTPEIVAIDIADGLPSYLQWIDETLNID